MGLTRNQKRFFAVEVFPEMLKQGKISASRLIGDLGYREVEDWLKDNGYTKEDGTLIEEYQNRFDLKNSTALTTTNVLTAECKNDTVQLFIDTYR